VHSTLHGFVTRIEVDRLCQFVRAQEDAAVVLRVSIGSYVSFNDVVAEVRAHDPAALEGLEREVRRALVIERKRDVGRDAIYGVEELQTIGWTSISSAKSNPAPGLMAICAMRDLLARWACDGVTERDPEAAPVVYVDPTIGRVFDAFETFAVASFESKQHQAFAEVAEAMAVLFLRLPVEWRPRADDTVRRIIACTGPHLFTAQADHALRTLAATLARANRHDRAREVERARIDLQHVTSNASGSTSST
jgi:hypothetical protein